jgi:hypothetical protein
MRVSRMLIGTAAAGATLILIAGPATAGEVTGNGKPTQGPAHANSICVFSGLEDGSEDPMAPSGPGVTQNWGQIPKAFRTVLTAEGAHPGDSCNGHHGFLAGGGGEP